MRKLTKMFGLAVAFAVVGAPAFADEAPTVSFSGGVDTYYSLNITNMSNDVAGNGNGALYGFTTVDNSYTLGLAELATKAKMGDASANIVAYFGEGAGIALLDPSFPSPGSLTQVGLMSANLSITKEIWTFTFGKFMTWMGNEVVESWLNMNQSRSVLFFGIPLYHTGFSVGVAPDSQFAATAYVVNGWNNQNAYSFASGEKTLGLQAKFMPADTGFTAILNGIYGPEPFGGYATPTAVGELILSYTVDKLTFVLDSQIGMNMPSEDVYGAGPHPHYYGFALYGKADLGEGWGIALRLEEVVEHASSLIGGGTNLLGYEYREATLTIESKVTSNMVARLEGRVDMDVMNGSGTAAYAGGEDNQITVTGSTAFFF
jgi:hypothetical protein